MNSGSKDEDIAEILDARSGQSALASRVARPNARPELDGLLGAADVAWVSQQAAPPLADDPVAAMLGLVPDPDWELDGRALANSRKRAGLTVSSLAQRLTRRGWEVTNKDIFAWEGGKNVPRIPALINALAEEAGADPDRLRRPLGADPERAKLTAVVESDAFKALAERWARLQGTTAALAASALESRMMVAVHRGSVPDADILLESLEVLVTAVEDNETP